MGDQDEFVEVEEGGGGGQGGFQSYVHCILSFSSSCLYFVLFKSGYS